MTGLALFFVLVGFVVVAYVIATALRQTNAVRDWWRGFSDADLAIAWRHFLDDAQSSRFTPLRLTKGQFNAYIWLQDFE